MTEMSLDDAQMAAEEYIRDSISPEALLISEHLDDLGLPTDEASIGTVYNLIRDAKIEVSWPTK